MAPLVVSKGNRSAIEEIMKQAVSQMGWAEGRRRLASGTSTDRQVDVVEQVQIPTVKILISFPLAYWSMQNGPLNTKCEIT